MVLDVAGTQSGQFGQLDITGSGTFDGTLDLNFINGFAPVTGDMFDFINLGGSGDFSGLALDITGLAPGFQYSDGFSDGAFTLTAQNNGVPTSTPEPGSLALLGTALAGISVFARLKRRCSSPNLEAKC